MTTPPRIWRPTLLHLSTLCGAAVEQGLGGLTPGSPPSFSAMGHLYFDSVEAFQAAFELHAGELMADIQNYTNVQPTIQVSEVKF